MAQRQPTARPERVQVHGRRILLADVFRVEEAELQFEKFDGTLSPVVRRLTFERGDSVAAVLYKPLQQCLVLVNQFRYPAYSRGDGWLVELVAGICRANESPDQTVTREVLEETGYRVRSPRSISWFYASPGGCSERIFLFYAEVDENVAQERPSPVPTSNEDIEVVEIPVSDLSDLLQSGTIKDAKTLIGLTWFLENKFNSEVGGAVASPANVAQPALDQEISESVGASDSEKQKCFVIMPYGLKKDRDGTPIDFDNVYDKVIHPAIEDLGCKCVRADRVGIGGSAHRDMLMHIIEDPIAVVDTTTLSPNVMYELGVRHTARERVTVMLARKGTPMPFNIGGFQLVRYDPTDESQFPAVRKTIQHMIVNGLNQVDRTDSTVHYHVPGLVVRKAESPIIKECKVYEYKIRTGCGKSVGIATGDLLGVGSIADVWVNPENVQMQMARPFDPSISGAIRYAGARRTKGGKIKEDVIADELRAQMDGETEVEPGTVICTGPGALGDAPYSLRMVFHVAAARGVIGMGYKPVDNLEACVTRVLETADSTDHAASGLKRILIPLLGTGTSQAELLTTVPRLVNAAVFYLSRRNDSVVERVYFLARRRVQLEALKRVMDASPELEARPG